MSAHVGAHLLHRPAEAERRPVWRRRTAKIALTATLLFGSLLAAPGTADAAGFGLCGHQVTTTYDQGWIIVTSMNGTEGRNDIWVTGAGISPNNGHYEFFSVPVQEAISRGVHWAAFDSARITINGTDCWAPVR